MIRILGLAVNLSNVEQAIISELKIGPDEAKLFVVLVKRGKMEARKISNALNWEEGRAYKTAISLVKKGMIIEIAKDEFESLHPRFAVSNRFKRRCEEENVPAKKNLKVDNIGIILESPYENARTMNGKP